ncbi:hypothetical protein AC244_30660 [Ensifer adhaerens]|uniref:Uncharacterized protein n=1 Tax=Ensifer adhaerens TaxID=106592 RepID=A0A0L8BFY9_ENSAD|nr:hypothetical protein AC244_30660 [Ensifer adhaerens]
MSRKSVQRLCDNDMRRNKNLKRQAKLKDRDALQRHNTFKVQHNLSVRSIQILRNYAMKKTGA